VITLSNGTEIDFVASGGALGYDGNGLCWQKPFELIGLHDPGLFTIVLKTITLHPKCGNWEFGNPHHCIRLIKDGMVNAIGLTNPGIVFWKKYIVPRMNFSLKLIPSIYGEPHDIAEMCRKFNGLDFKAIEINASCPNVDKGIVGNNEKILESCRKAKNKSRHPIILKVSVLHDIYKVIKLTEDIVEAYSINSVPWSYVFPEHESPLRELGGGGVSGKAAQKINWDLAKKIISLTDRPVVVPIWNFDDVYKAEEFGAKAFSFCTRFLLQPWAPTAIVRKCYSKIEDDW